MRILRLAAIALSAMALAATGCGTEKRSSAAPEAGAAGVPIQRYVEQVAGLGQAIDDARSDYFHANHTRAAIKHGTTEVQAAYARAATRLATITPPGAAADLHRQLAAAWQRRATQLEEVIGTKPLDTSRIDDLMAEAGRDVSTAELYTLPQ